MPMGVRPPTGSTDPPDTVEFGIAALASELEDAELDYPTDRDAVVRSLGDPDVPVTASGRTIPLSRALDDVDVSQFDSERELLNALHPVFESYRANVSTGVLASVRDILPF